MAKKQIPINERTFVRTLKAIDKDGKEVLTFIAQPYCVGMYVILNNDAGSQMNIPNKKYPSWVKGSIKKMEMQGLTVTTTESKYSSFLKEDELIDYVFPK